MVAGEAPAADGQVFDADDDAYVLRLGLQTRVRLADFTATAAQAGAGDGAVKAPMHGRLLEILVATGDRVDGGQRLAVIEAMKMEHTLRAPFAGVITAVPVAVGAQVVEGAQIVVIEPSAAL
jgi:3-methylcrotonyl-CoA carboxylase alpha subunit